MNDTELMDFIEEQGEPEMVWVARASLTGRGFRLHQSYRVEADALALSARRIGIADTPRAALEALANCE